MSKQNEITKRQFLGRLGEYYAYATLLSLNMNIYTPEIDDHGIDLIAEKPNGNGYFKFQVKTIDCSNYVFMRKQYFNCDDENLFLILNVIHKNEDTKTTTVDIYIIPATAWSEKNITAPLVSRDYIDKKSAPEFGINISTENLNVLEKYKIGTHEINELKWDNLSK